MRCIPGHRGHFFNYDFNENKGTTIYDRSGYGNSNLTFNTQGTFGLGKLGGALSNPTARDDAAGDDAGAFGEDDDDLDFANGADFTLSTWVYYVSKPFFTDKATIFGKNNCCGDPEYLFRIPSSNNKLEFSLIDNAASGNDTYSVQSTNNLPQNTWTHVAGVFDDDGGVNIYINGVLDATSTKVGTLANIGSFSGSSEIHVGTGFYDFGGEVDEARIYNYARTAQQIVEDMNGGHPVGGSPIASQVARWTFDEQNGTTVNNQNPTQSSLTGAISGATWKTKEVCKINGCLEWDGTDDVVTVTNATALDLNDNLAAGFTIGGWIYADSDGEADTGQFFQKGTTTYCRTDSQSGSNLDIECSLDLATSDATLNIASAITTGTWNHILVSYTDDADDEITIWINGKNRGSSTNGSGAPAAESSNLLMGGTTTANFDGKIDEFKIYPGELTLEQIGIDQNANASINLGTGSDEAAQVTEGAGQPPIAYWNLDENTGTAANDRSGNGNTGTLNNQIRWFPGKIGQAIGLNGTTQYVDLGDMSSTESVSTLTWELWVKPIVLSTGRAILTKGNGLAATEEAWAIGTSSVTASTLVVVIATNTTDLNTYGSVANALSAHSWTHITAVFDGTLSGNDNRLKVFINGIPQTVSFTGTIPASTTATTSTARIGSSSDGAVSTFFTGLVDEIKIFNYARTPAQMAYDYNRGVPVGWWKFDECQATTVHDTSGGGNTGTITPGGSGNTAAGTCTSGTSTHMWNDGATGKLNASLGFDGTDDYVEINDTANLRFDSSSQDFSVFAWVKRTTTGTEYILSKEDADNDGWRLVFTSSNTVQCSEDATDVTSTRPITDTNWHHIGCVVDRDGNGQVYMDGKPDGSAVSMGSDAMATTSNIRIGTRSYTSTSYLNGQIDDVRIYNYTLSGLQVKTVMNGGAGVRFGP